MSMVQERTGHLTGHGGLRLFYRTWTPEEARGSIVLVHGMNEHSGRYQHVAEYFTSHGLTVYALDHRGHGQSQGTRCYIDRFDDYLHDLHSLVQMAQDHGKPVMVGHSMGGLIAFRYTLAYPGTIAALVLSSPFFRAKIKPNPVEQALAPLLSVLLPKLQLPANIAPDQVTRNLDVAKAIAADPLGWTKATPRWFTECTKAALACHQGLAPGVKMPVLFLQAGDDQIVDPEATRAVYEQVPPGRKAFKLYPGKYHEIFNDPGHDEVLGDILQWLQEQELVPSL